jgi:serine/threonine protein kinase
LIDFGTVKKIGNIAAESTTQPASAIIGTPGYYAPEQALGFPKSCSDIYSVGVVCIQALTGILPSQLPKHAETGDINWHNQAEVSPQLTKILDKMVRYNFRDRYQFVREVLQDLNDSFGENTIFHPSRDVPLIPTLVDIPVVLERNKTSFKKPNVTLIVGLIIFITGILLTIFVQKTLKPEKSTPIPKQHMNLGTDDKRM